MTVWRVVKASRTSTAFDGEGAHLNGGRWNSPGLPAVYLSATKSLALLEILVHLDPNDAPKRWTAFRISLRPDQIETVKLPPRWPTREARTQQIGDAWIQNRRSLALAVPSVIVQEEFNYLLNPTHPDFPKLNLSKLLPFTLDLRLLA